MKIQDSSKIRIGQLFCFALVISAPMSAFGLESVRFAIKELCQHMEGNLGGLLMVTAGVGGMISAAFGNMKALYTCIITAIGAFTASSMLSLYFPEAHAICTGQGGGTTTRTTKAQRSHVSQIDEVAAVNGFFRLGDEPESSNLDSNQDSTAQESSIQESSNQGGNLGDSEEESNDELF
jgi:hypothetical protein